jgi:hypothetical protein
MDLVESGNPTQHLLSRCFDTDAVVYYRGEFCGLEDVEAFVLRPSFAIRCIGDCAFEMVYDTGVHCWDAKHLGHEYDSEKVMGHLEPVLQLLRDALPLVPWLKNVLTVSELCHQVIPGGFGRQVVCEILPDVCHRSDSITDLLPKPPTPIIASARRCCGC